MAQANRVAWEAASQKYVREYGDLLAQAASGSSLTGTERDFLREIWRCSPQVVHLQAATAWMMSPWCRRRADELGAACRYVAAAVPGVPLASTSADLVYTGKGVLIWMPDLTGWAREVARVLRPSGHLFVYEAHPAVTLRTWDEDLPRIREDRSYFGRSHINDTFPARGAVEWQWTLGQIVTAVAATGMEILHLGEYPEPFRRADGVAAAAWEGRLPNSFALLARRTR